MKAVSLDSYLNTLGSSWKGLALKDASDFPEFSENHCVLDEKNILLYFDHLPSTSDFAHTRLAELTLNKQLLVLAQHQSAGHGRLGRAWFAPAQSTLTFTLLFCAPRRLSAWLPLAAALALEDSVCNKKEAPSAKNKHTSFVDLKWPNDLLHKEDGKKFAGILCESRLGQEQALFFVGVGVNVGPIDFPDELKDTATTLSKISGAQVSPEIILKNFCEKLPLLLNTPSAQLATLYESKSSYTQGKFISCQLGEEHFTGITCGLDPVGGGLWCQSPTRDTPTLLRVSEIHALRKV